MDIRGLDDLAQKVRTLQTSNSVANPPALYVDREGNIGEVERPGEERQLTRLTGETFAAVAYTDRWIDEQRQLVRRHLPPDTREVMSNGVLGWAFGITNEFGHSYTFWTAFDEAERQWVAFLVEPAPALIRSPSGATSAHDRHLFEDGRICLTPGVGCRDLPHLFARVALWCRGASCYQLGQTFVFNPGR